MAGAESALVLIPRFTSFVGAGEFTSVPIDVSGVGSAQIELFRGPLLGEDASPAATFRAYLEESIDGVVWQPDADHERPHDPGAGKSMVLAQIFSLRWFRIRVKLTDATANRPKVTCWAEGMLR